MNGHGSLAGLMPFSNANDVVVSMASDVLPVVKHTPVIAGVCASDPGRDMEKFLRQLQEMGFAGVQNFPTVGLIDGNFRANLEETGMGFGREVEMVRIASGMGLVTTPYVFNGEEARAMVEAGADVVVAHSEYLTKYLTCRFCDDLLMFGILVGLTTSGTIGAKTGKSLEQCVEDIQAIQAAARKVRDDVIILCHGGPIAKPEDARYVLERCKGLHGFFGASSMERLPVEEAIAGVTIEFKGIPISK
jgi:predicted TIM-barrel enzyme